MTREFKANRVEYTEAMLEDFIRTLEKLKNNRKMHSIYYMDLLCSSGAIVGFDYYYGTQESALTKTLDLKQHGEITFAIDPLTGYARIVSEGYRELVDDVIESMTP